MARPAQAESAETELPPTAIGEIIGPDFTVKGQVGISQREGRVVTRLESGSEVTVHRGQALIRLASGGSIRLCQPMKVSLLKSAGGLTVAFDRGTLRMELRGSENLSLHTPWFTVARPREDRAAERSALAGLDAEGKLCLRTIAGEWMVREQLGTGQLAVPAGNEFVIEPNKLTEPRRASDACACPEENLDEPRLQTTPQTNQASEVPAAAKTPETAHASVSTPAPTEPSQTEPAKLAQPEWKAIMPPLVYEAKPTGSAASKETAADDARAPALLAPATWQGAVTAAASSAHERVEDTSPRTGIVERIKSFFRALFGGRGKKSASS